MIWFEKTLVLTVYLAGIGNSPTTFKTPIKKHNKTLHRQSLLLMTLMIQAVMKNIYILEIPNPIQLFLTTKPYKKKFSPL